MKVSIILPVYNVGNYIENNIKSLINETYKDIEIIYVSDGSTDNSVDIIKKYMKSNKNIILYEKENGGVSSARNYGLSKATGEYIMFVDSDDVLDEDTIKKLVDTLTINNNPDIVIFNYDIVSIGKREPSKIMDGVSRFITPNEYMITTPCPWNKIYKREFLIKNNYHFPEGHIYEDMAATPTLAKYKPKVYYLDEYLYDYIQSEDSLMRSHEYKKKYEDIFPAIDYMYNELKDTEYKEELTYLIAYHMLYLANLNFYKYKKYEHMKEISKVTHKYIPKWIINILVREKFTKKQIFYMYLMYHNMYKLLDIYHIFKKGE